MHRGVDVRALQQVTPARLKELKDGEETKRKVYRVLCWLARPFTTADATLLAACSGLDVLQARLAVLRLSDMPSCDLELAPAHNVPHISWLLPWSRPLSRMSGSPFHCGANIQASAALAQQLTGALPAGYAHARAAPLSSVVSQHLNTIAVLPQPACLDLCLQATPVRVLHRRAALARPRTLHRVEALPLPGRPQYFVLDLETQAGTYVKEFVHGDFGRTVPSVASLLGCRAELVQLDVTAVLLDFP